MINKLIPVLLFAAVFCFRAEVSNAQQTRTEVVKATTPEEDARLHVLLTLADSNGAFGGHLEEGTHVFTFAIITVGVFKDGIHLSKVDDKTYR